MNEQAINSAQPILQARGLGKTFDDGRLRLNVLDNVNLLLHRGERLAIVGSSGSGKSTLLHCLGGLDAPSRGEVLVSGRNMAALSDAERGRLRNERLGFVYQFHHLLPEFSALENVALPLLIRRMPAAQAREQAAALLGRVGLGERLQHKPGELSGGERHRAGLRADAGAQPGAGHQPGRGHPRSAAGRAHGPRLHPAGRAARQQLIAPAAQGCA
jgi:lipoprotein-releasing system ATP-binding protein